MKWEEIHVGDTYLYKGTCDRGQHRLLNTYDMVSVYALSSVWDWVYVRDLVVTGIPIADEEIFCVNVADLHMHIEKAIAAKQSCKCDIIILMNSGCRCGGI